MPEVLLVNPRRRRRKATRKRKRAVARRTNPVRRRRRRAAPTAHRRIRRVHARRVRRNPRRHRRVRRNPLHMGNNVFMRGASIAAAGLAVEVLANKLASFLPASWALDANVTRIGCKAAITIGVPMLAKKVKIIPAGVANAIAIGGAVVTVMDIINTYVKPHLPAGLLSEYDPNNSVMQGYETGTLSGDEDSMHGYEAGQLSGGAYGGGAYAGGIGY